MIKANILTTEHYGEEARILNCIEEEGEFYYIVELKDKSRPGGKQRKMLHESSIEIL